MQIQTTPSSAEAAASPRDIPWGAIGSMTMCTAMLIASEFMPVSLLTPIAADLHATSGQAGQAISVSGLFAIATCLVIAPVSSRFDRRNVLMAMTVLLLASLVLVAAAPNFMVLMVGRALLGITIGGFWSLATATVMRLAPAASVPKALAVMYTGNSIATAFAAPIGSYLGGFIGWRGVFFGLVPFALLNLAWQWRSLPKMPAEAAIPASRIVGLLRRKQVAIATVACMLTFGGAFAAFTYFRPFLETYTHASVDELSMLLLALGSASFVGTAGATALLKNRLYVLLWSLPLALGSVTAALLLGGHSVWFVAGAFFLWGALNAGLPVAWFNWLAIEVSDEAEAGGALMVGAIQLSIMAGAGIGGVLLDHISLAATFIAATAMLVLAAAVVGNGKGLRRQARVGPQAGNPSIATVELSS